jgi:hypothetical protein
MKQLKRTLKMIKSNYNEALEKAKYARKLAEEKYDRKLLIKNLLKDLKNHYGGL